MKFKAALKKQIKNLTAKIGKATRENDDSTAQEVRIRRDQLMQVLALHYDVWTLINSEGKTEWVDRGEWEHRMVAWARRNGRIPRGNLGGTAVAEGGE